MKRRIDDLVVGVKQDSPSVGGVSATTPLSSSSGVFSTGARGGPAAAAAAGGGSVTLGTSRQSHSPATQLLHQAPPNPCIVAAGPTIVQSVRANSPAVKSDPGGPTMPGSLTYPVQGYPTPTMPGNTPNPTVKGTSGGLQGGSPVVVTGGTPSSSSSSHPSPSHSLHSLQPPPQHLAAAHGLGSGPTRHKAPRPGGAGLARAQQQRGGGGIARSGSHDAPPPPSQVHSSSGGGGGGASGNSAGLTAAQQSQQQQFQRLKVEDALSYLDQVKFKFGNQPQVYNDFLDIMKEFKSQSIDTPGVIARVSNLFKGHPELIVGFNTFLPPGYKIEVQANDQVSVSMPSPTNTTTVGSVTHHHTLPISSGPATPVVSQTAAVTPTPATPAPTSVNTGGATSSTLSQILPPPSTPGITPIPIKPVSLPSGPIGSDLAAVHHAATSLHGYSSPVSASSSPHHPPNGAQAATLPAASTPSTGGSGGGGPSSLLSSQSGHAGAQMLAESMQPTPQSQPVDFTHAINYVNKIKNRFQGQPDKYKSFLDILHAYQKEQRSLKEGLSTSGKHLTEAEVYSQVAKLFENQEDLVQEFGQFLPDATSHQAALMGAVLQSNKGLSNDHTSAKKPLSLKPGFNNASAGLAALSMGAGAMGNNSKFGGQQVKRSPSFSPSSQPPSKKPKMVSLRDISLADAGKYGSLNDYAFFDKVRKALKSQEVYENFLRCLVLFNQEVVSRTELVQLVTPFLGRFPELLRWFKEFLGHTESSSTAAGGPSCYQSLHSSALTDLGSANSVARQDRASSDLAMEIDYSACKRLGASYCALPKIYPQPRCSGRTPLCKEVLNDTWVSFPTWSEDSTFVTSRKTQYEEYMYRCEDERFELDMVLETNAATIRVLEGVNKKMQRMQLEEVAKFHLDDHLGGSSMTIHQRALARIYGDKAPDIIMGLKKNPSAAVPVVLRRLKAKEDEWREAQKGFNKLWREQNEKYYLKSLDHQGINFKQNDVKALRSKALFNEIETMYDERHEQAEEGASDVASGPHLVLSYRDKSVLDDAANLLIHHVKRQTGIHKDDKQTIKQLLRHFIPDLFFHPRQELSDDERDDDMQEDREEGETSNHGSKASKSKTESEVKKEPCESDNKEAVPSGAATTVTTTTQAKTNSQCSSSSSSTSSGDKDPLALPPHALSSLPDEHYTLFMASNTWYLFLRLHQILCERLTRMYERAMILAAEEAQNKLDRKESTAVALRLKPKNDIEVEYYYPAFLDMVKNVLDGNMESNAYEDTLREMFGIHAYIAFTLDKVLQSLVVDESSQECLEMFQEEQKKGATGGPCSQAAHNLAAELAYQRRAEQALAEENCYKVYIYKRDCKLTIELLDSEVEEPETAAEAEKGASYLEKYVSGLDTLSDDVRERLARKPVFLPRNVRHYQRRGKQEPVCPEATDQKDRPSASTEAKEGKSSDTEDKKQKPSNGNGSSEEEKGKEKRPSQSPPSQAESVDGTECRFNLSSYTRVYVVDKESIMFKREALLKAKESHPAVSRRLSRRFRAWHHSWADEHVTEEQQKLSCDWLMGRGENVIPNRTRIFTNNDLSRPPYCPYNRYRVEKLADSSSSSSSSSSSGGTPSTS